MKRLELFKKKADIELENFFNDKERKAKKIDPVSVEMINLLKDYSLRSGRRIRSAFLYFGYMCFKKNNLDELLKASISIELIQSYLLIHDDIMDCSDLRRGKPSLHKSYEKICKIKYKNKDSKQFGLSMAIIAGDILAAFANEILTKVKFKEKYKIAALRKINHINHIVIYGQALDVLSGFKNITKKDISLIHRLKTASYTVEGPLHIGAILAGASEKQLKVLTEYGVPLGKAFQLQDDILGLFGDSNKTGKPNYSDLKEGKKTLLILKALEKGNNAQKEIIDNALGNKNLTQQQLNKVRRVIKETGSLEYSKSLAKNLIKKSRKAIINSRFKKQGKDFLIYLNDSMIDREY